MLAKYKKALGSVLGAASGSGLVSILSAFGVHLDLGAATAIAGGLAALGALLAPKNSE